MIIVNSNEEGQIAPKSEWKNLSLTQLYEVKSQMTTRYFSMRAAKASFAPQYAAFIAELDSRIYFLESDFSAENQEADQ